jgi:hypothetical protein
MSNPPAKATSGAAVTAAKVAPPTTRLTEGILGVTALEEQAERRVDEIEMIGEEEAAGLPPPGVSAVSAGMRYLHCSRTIHQLVIDRNRAVGVYIAVASLLWTASSAILNAHHNDHLIVPIETIQRACLPATFGALAVLALFVGFLLIRTRIGLIYEVAKMNALLGLPIGRVKRVNPLSIFFIMHALVSVAGGGSAALLAYHLLVAAGQDGTGRTWLFSVLIGVAIAVLLILLYIGTVLYTTADEKLRGGAAG